MTLQPLCCPKPSIQNMDHNMWADERGNLFVWHHAQFTKRVFLIHRVCLRCGCHWYGLEGEEKLYSLEEWAGRMHTASAQE
ncbi:MAG TPA: hypothetical protein VK149_13350 [Sideroxyarcus sp.]|nr:hypothetical protein [Sideroxyarcus sp.]